MTSTLRAKAGAAARRVGIVALLCAPAAASLVASAAAVHAAPSTPVPNANHEVGMYGDPSAAAPYWRQQHSSDCGELAVADVVGQITGHEPTEQQITALAKSTPSTAGAGSILNLPANTDIRDLPVLLAHYWIKADNIQTSINALEQDLAEKRRVIVILNAETLWNRPRQTQRREPLRRCHRHRPQSRCGAPQRQRHYERPRRAGAYHHLRAGLGP